MTAQENKDSAKTCAINSLLLEFEDGLQDHLLFLLNKARIIKIPLKENTQPINLRPYRHLGAWKDVIEQMTTEMLQAWVIQQSSSPYSSLVILVKKKDQPWHKCIDYKALNNQTIKENYLVPVIEEILDE